MLQIMDEEDKKKVRKAAKKSLQWIQKGDYSKVL